MSAAVLLAAALAGLPEPVDYQKVADEARWEWQEDQASVGYSFRRYQGAFQLELVRTGNHVGDDRVRFVADGKEVYAWRGHYATAFVVSRDDSLLYYADYHPSSSGCRLVAVDLCTGKVRWKSDLEGLGPIDHSKYRNKVTLDLLEDGVLCVRGNESAGNYVEFVDGRTGKTVGHKVFER